MSLARVGALAALALVALDVAAVPAVLPSARLELGSSTSGVVWVQDAHLLALAVTASLLGQAGRVSLLGHAARAIDRRALAAAGLAGFAAGALLASTADGTATLVTGRALQGAGAAALLVPAIEGLRPETGERGHALELVAAGALLALALAPLVGGAVAEETSWRWLFRLELVAVVAAIPLLAGGRKTAPVRPSGAQRPALAAGLVCGATGLIQSGPWGWGSPDTLLLLAAGGALLAFAWRDGLSGPDAAAFAVAGALAAALLLAPQYLELVRGLSPLRSGLLTLAITLPAATLAGLAAVRGSRRPLVAGGLACAAVGALGMTRIDPASSYALVVVSLGLLGTGFGAAAARTAGAAAAPGAALVVAAAGALLQHAQLDEREAGGSFEAALAAGVAASGWLLAAVLAAAALLAWRQRAG